MMQYIHKAAIMILLLSLVNPGVFAKSLPSTKFRRSLDGDVYVDNQLPSLTDQDDTSLNGDLLEALMDPPSKRQWCRKGMIYNHVLGSCTFSFSAFRNRSKWQ